MEYLNGLIDLPWWAYGLVTLGFIVLVIGGFLAVTLLGGEGHQATEKCAHATSVHPAG